MIAGDVIVVTLDGNHRRRTSVRTFAVKYSTWPSTNAACDPLGCENALSVSRSQNIFLLSHRAATSSERRVFRELRITHLGTPKSWRSSIVARRSGYRNRLEATVRGGDGQVRRIRHVVFSKLV